MYRGRTVVERLEGEYWLNIHLTMFTPHKSSQIPIFTGLSWPNIYKTLIVRIHFHLPQNKPLHLSSFNVCCYKNITTLKLHFGRQNKTHTKALVQKMICVLGIMTQALVVTDIQPSPIATVFSCAPELNILHILRTSSSHTQVWQGCRWPLPEGRYRNERWTSVVIIGITLAPHQRISVIYITKAL